MTKRTSQIEGYWQSPANPEFPLPVAHDEPFDGQEGFVAYLRKLEGSLRPRLFRGMSNCRICNMRNGSGEFEYNGWTWPTGLLHYITEHNVLPSPEFRDMVFAAAGVRPEVTRYGKHRLPTSASDEITGFGVPHDVITHRDAWRGILARAIELAKQEDDVTIEERDANVSYYEHELTAFDRTFAVLAQLPVLED